jgi:hypothetical protein
MVLGYDQLVQAMLSAADAQRARIRGISDFAASIANFANSKRKPVKPASFLGGGQPKVDNLPTDKVLS